MNSLCWGGVQQWGLPHCPPPFPSLPLQVPHPCPEPPCLWLLTCSGAGRQSSLVFAQQTGCRVGAAPLRPLQQTLLAHNTQPGAEQQLGLKGRAGWGGSCVPSSCRNLEGAGEEGRILPPLSLNIFTPALSCSASMGMCEVRVGLGGFQTLSFPFVTPSLLLRIHLLCLGFSISKARWGWVLPRAPSPCFCHVVGQGH